MACNERTGCSCSCSALHRGALLAEGSIGLASAAPHPTHLLRLSHRPPLPQSLRSSSSPWASATCPSPPGTTGGWRQRTGGAPTTSGRGEGAEREGCSRLMGEGPAVGRLTLLTAAAVRWWARVAGSGACCRCCSCRPSCCSRPAPPQRHRGGLAQEGGQEGGAGGGVQGLWQEVEGPAAWQQPRAAAAWMDAEAPFDHNTPVAAAAASGAADCMPA